MRKQTLLFFAGAMLVMASCNTTNQDTTADQATIDSMVNARVEELREQMMLENDSLINELAWMRADSIINAQGAAASNVGSNSRTTTTRGTTRGGGKTTTQPTKPVTSGSKWESDEKGTTSKSKWEEKGEGEEKKEPTSKSKWGN